MTAHDAEQRSETWVGQSPLARYELRTWRETFGVVAGVTGRACSFDVSKAAAGSRWQSGAWHALESAVGDAFRAIVVSEQVHGTAVGTLLGEVDGLRVERGFDGHITDQAGVLLTVTLADCIPVYLLHPSSRTLGLVHAGWRGTAAGILEAAVARLCALTHASPRDLVIHCGVGICGVCYEVGSEVIRAMGGVGETPCRFDLRRELAGRAARTGVGHITLSAWCTAHDHDRFYSHRWEGSGAGRMVGYVGRPLEPAFGGR